MNGISILSVVYHIYTVYAITAHAFRISASLSLLPFVCFSIICRFIVILDSDKEQVASATCVHLKLSIIYN